MRKMAQSGTAPAFRRPAHLLRVLIVALAAAGPGISWPHADVELRIGALSEQISQHPEDAALYLRRGNLHREHRDWDAALADYDRAETLRPGWSDLLYHRGLLWLAADRPEQALSLLDAFVAQVPDQPRAYQARAEAKVRLGRTDEAVRDYTLAIDLDPDPRPDVYLVRAKLLLEQEPPHLDEALAGLDQAAARFGTLPNLTELAIQAELAAGRYDAALGRLDALGSTVASNPAWLAKRAEILEAAGRIKEARETCQKALSTIDDFPPARRDTQAMRSLETDLVARREHLQAISGEPSFPVPEGLPPELNPALPR